MFHLLSHTEGDGGASLLVDGFQASRQLRQRFPEAFKTFTDFRVPCHSNGNPGISLRPTHFSPVLVHSNGNTAVKQVRWNNNDRGTLPSRGTDVDAWYDAARKWVNILQSPENEYWEQLVPGRPLSMWESVRRQGQYDANLTALVFDNWRVLHGRSAFTGKRRMCGGYSKHELKMVDDD